MKSVRHRILALATAVLALTVAGCIDREETVTVHPDGSTTMHVEINGDQRSYLSVLTFPSAPEWTILEQHIDTTGKPDDFQFKYVAERTVAYGNPFPVSFANPSAPRAASALQFPTEVRRWSEDGRDFYEFKRTFRARRFACYSLADTDTWDQDLEDRVLKKGIFNVSETDRQKYLQQFTSTFGYMQWRFLWQALASMARHDHLDDSTRLEIETKAADYLDSTLTPDHILTMLKGNDSTLDSAMIRLTAETRTGLTQIAHRFGWPDGPDQEARFRQAFDDVLHDYAVTEAIGAQKFSLDLSMPGSLVDANGLVDYDLPGEVHWEFPGNKLNDADVTLYALSVVDHGAPKK